MICAVMATTPTGSTGLENVSSLDWTHKDDALAWKELVLDKEWDGYIVGRKTFETLPDNVKRRIMEGKHSRILSTKAQYKFSSEGQLKVHLGVVGSSSKILVIGGNRTLSVIWQYIDSITLVIQPRLLESNSRQVENLSLPATLLKLVSAKTFGQVVALTYQKTSSSLWKGRR